jgi:hypothetical protein
MSIQVYRKITIQKVAAGTYKVYLPGCTQKVNGLGAARKLVDVAWTANSTLIPLDESKSMYVSERNSTFVKHPLELMTPAERAAWGQEMAGLFSQLMPL